MHPQTMLIKYSKSFTPLELTPKKDNRIQGEESLRPGFDDLILESTRSALK